MGVSYFASRLLMTNVVTQKGTLSGRSDLTMSIRCNSLQEFSHSCVHVYIVYGEGMHIINVDEHAAMISRGD